MLALSVLILPPLDAQGQNPNNRALENEIKTAWLNVCKEIGGQEPWQTHIDKLEPLVARAKELEQGPMLRDYLDAMILARDYQKPDDLTVLEASPEQLIGMLTESRLFGPARSEFILLTSPLRLGTENVYWNQIADLPPHDYLDPAIETFRRGRDIIPYLIDALDDMTATRSWYRPSSTRYWSVMVRRADFAMAILEAMTRIKFYPHDAGYPFSHQPADKRVEIIARVKEWWTQNKEADPFEARLWALERADVIESFWMLNVLGFEKHTGIVVEHLHRLLDRIQNQGTKPPEDQLRDIARRLAMLNDKTGIRFISDQVQNAQNPNINDLRLLALFGGREEFEMLARRYAEGMSTGKGKPPSQRNSPSKTILSAAEQAKNPLAVVIFAEALFNEEKMVPWPAKSDRRPHNWSSMDIAAENIQKLTGRDFGYSQRAKISLRRFAIDRIRDWWRLHGEKHHQTVSATDGKSDAIR